MLPAGSSCGDLINALCKPLRKTAIFSEAGLGVGRVSLAHWVGQLAIIAYIGFIDRPTQRSTDNVNQSLLPGIAKGHVHDIGTAS